MNHPVISFLTRPLVAFLVVVALQTAALSYMVVNRALILRNGSEVTLRTTPIDPRDLLRGDYVTLGYTISNTAQSFLTGDKPTTNGRYSVWVRVEKNQSDRFWEVSEASFQPLPPKEGSVVIRSQPFNLVMYTPGEIYIPPLDFGIERYYVPEGEGKDIETMRNTDELQVIVRVSPSGTAQIARLDVGGKPLYDEPLY